MSDDDYDREPECCSCHLSAPCAWCLGACVECRRYVGEDDLDEVGLCEYCDDVAEGDA